MTFRELFIDDRRPFKQEAALALEEAIHIAQQANDHAALAHALAALTALADAASPAASPLRSSPQQQAAGREVISTASTAAQAAAPDPAAAGPHGHHIQLLRLLRTQTP